MDRLLSDQEQAGLIWELSATIEGSEGRQPTQQEIHEYLLKAQDAKTASLVAQEIFKELEEYFGLHETDCNGKDVLAKLTVREDIVMNYNNKSMNQLNIYRAIKEKHGVLDD